MFWLERIRFTCAACSGVAKVSLLWAAVAQRSLSVRRPPASTRSGLPQRRYASTGCDLVLCKGWAPFWVSACRQCVLGMIVPTVLTAAGVMGMSACHDRAVAADKGFRKLAAGVLTVIPPDTSADDTEQHGDLLEITRGRADSKWKPNEAPSNTTLIERAKNLEFQRNIWYLEFAFKPPRTIDVDVPTLNQRMQRKRLWYLVYRVKNTGGRRTVVDKIDPSKRTTKKLEGPVLFLPHFVLEGLEALSDAEGTTSYRGYLDRVVPSAMAPIRMREDQARELFDSAQMASQPIAPGEERWGVAVWEDVDSRIDFFSIFVRGLTNSIRWREKARATFAKNEPMGASMEQTLECLRLDFWRPGDDGRNRDQEMSVGYAGFFERMTLGTRLIEAVGRPPLIQSSPVEGLVQLGLEWSDLLEGPGSNLAPLEKVVRKLLAMKDPAGRGPAVRNLFGDIGVEHFAELSRALTATVVAEREAARAAALTKVGLSREVVESAPLKSLAEVLKALDAIQRSADRSRLAEQLFGPAQRHILALARDLEMARTVAVLETIDADWKAITSGTARSAFTSLQTLIDAEPDAKTRKRMLEGMFGTKGPALYAAATLEHEGIDHSWVFRYETD